MDTNGRGLRALLFLSDSCEFVSFVVSLLSNRQRDERHAEEDGDEQAGEDTETHGGSGIAPVHIERDIGFTPLLRKIPVEPPVHHRSNHADDDPEQDQPGDHGDDSNGRSHQHPGIQRRSSGVDRAQPAGEIEEQ